MTNDEKLKIALQLAMEEDLKAFVPDPELEEEPKYKPPKSGKLIKLIAGIGITGLSSAAMLLLGVGIYQMVFRPNSLTGPQSAFPIANDQRFYGKDDTINNGETKINQRREKVEEAEEGEAFTVSSVLSFSELPITQTARDILDDGNPQLLLDICPDSDTADRFVKLYQFTEFSSLCELDSTVSANQDSSYYVLFNDSEFETTFRFDGSTGVCTCSPNCYVCFMTSNKNETIHLTVNDLEKDFSL